MSDDEAAPSSADILKLLDTLQVAVEATASSAAPLLAKAKAGDESLDLSGGLSLLLVRPHMLLASLHHLVQLVGLRLSSCAEHTPDAAPSAALTHPFATGRSARPKPSSAAAWENELAGELQLCHDVMDKVRGMETKLDYQVKKLVGLAEAAGKAKAAAADLEEDPLSFRPNASAMVDAARADATQSSKEDGKEKSGVYRPPRVAAMRYDEPDTATQKRKDRRAPALLSEFAQGLDGAPGLQTTSGLSTRPVVLGAHTNSVSAKRAAELKRIAEFEEDNMTRLVTTKREMKRRRDDEEALALGFGVGGRGRTRRQNGLEAELEGVLGERGSRGLWDGVNSKLAKRDDITDRGKRATVDAGERKAGPKKARFEKDIAKKRRAIGLPAKSK
ncbi:uncharacterized protein EHS24_008869 [Apiotrichum porosum]|uniref:Uncharacterized protein n=1 Tax=Apiotrichum porosum TaxID=105984 RepID=A0A427XN57_9TREE|nr:uncharacterized protein EHS24_008869 [Apiotrichum porosum]RSH80296.1 hypothetical protein EHS24_008869 [Apiotrichum porosum]